MYENILYIVGVEPNGSLEDPFVHQVGMNGITRIEYNMMNYGDHGIGEFNVYRGDHLHATVMHRAVAEITYQETPE